MSNICLKILNKNMETLAVNRGEDEVNLVYAGEYQDGDVIIIEVIESLHYVWMQIDDAIGKAMVYVTGNITYKIPFGERRTNLSPKAFYGKKHLLSVRTAKEFELTSYRNLALNVNDQHNITNLYPHVTANVETRGEAIFAAQNAVDGVTVSNCHGEWPYESWGINKQSDARLKIDFGREVITDRIILYGRADFPHDNWWEKVSIVFSDKSKLDKELCKIEGPQEIIFSRKVITWLELYDMKQSPESSPFPALTQIEVYGKESKSEKEKTDEKYN